jgi:hypothetical protein
MAGDLPFEEILVIHQEPTAAVAAAEAASAPLLVEPLADEPAGRVLQRYGDRVEIRMGGDVADPAAVKAPKVSAKLLASLTETERLGVQALQLRASKAHLKAKANRPREGEIWDMPGCAGAPAPPEALPDLEDSIGASAEAPAAGAEAGAPGTSDYLAGSVAVGLVIVNGPTAATKFTSAERTKVVAEVQAGLGWLAGFNPWAGVSFVYDIRPVSITTQPNASASDNESRFRNPAMGKLGFKKSWDGVWDYVKWLRANRNTNWAYCIFFVKGYPLDHFAYASIGGPRIVMDYANDGWGPDNIDRVVAHESGHIFGCPDEYASSGCNCGGTWGRFGEANSNCENCAGAAGVGCLMRANEWKMCSPTKRHLGWGLTSLRTTQPSSCNVVSRSTDKLDVFVTDGGGHTVTAAWEPAMVSWWEGWWNLLGGRAAPGAPVTCVSRRRDFLDVFVVGTDGGAYTCAWEPGRGWRGWWRIGNAVFPQGARISPVSRSTDHLDIFATDTAGRVLTAAWEPAFADGWHGWWDLKGGRARPGAPVSAVSRSNDKLDVFVTGTDGGCYTAAWEPGFADWWHGWWRIKNAAFPQGAYIGAVSRSADHLDIFGTDTGGKILTAAWEPAFADGWHGWWQIRGGMAAPGAPVTAVSRSADKLDVFVIGTDNTTYTAAWEPAFADGWHGWWNLNGGKAAHGSYIHAVSRRANFLDVFVVGLDGRVYTAAWSPGNTWGGWWPMGR